MARSGLAMVLPPWLRRTLWLAMPEVASVMPRPVNHTCASLRLSSRSAGVTRLITGPWVSSRRLVLLCWLVPNTLSKRAWNLTSPAARFCRSPAGMLSAQVPLACTSAVQVLPAKGWLAGRSARPTVTLRPAAVLIGWLAGRMSLTLPLKVMPAKASLPLMRLSPTKALSQLRVGRAFLTTHSPLLMSVLVASAVKPKGSTETATSYTPSVVICLVVSVSLAKLSDHCRVLAL